MNSIRHWQTRLSRSQLYQVPRLDLTEMISVFIINGIDARKFGSQGQQRTVALSLKIAEIKLVKKIINDNPILLLDDVMTELDTSRSEALIEEIKDIQTIITCTGYDDFVKEQVIINNVYSVVEGTATRVRTEEA